MSQNQMGNMKMVASCMLERPDWEKDFQFAWREFQLYKNRFSYVLGSISYIKSVVCNQQNVYWNPGCCNKINTFETANPIGLIEADLEGWFTDGWATLMLLDCGQPDWKIKAFDTLRYLAIIQRFMKQYMALVNRYSVFLEELTKADCNLWERIPNPPVP